MNRLEKIIGTAALSVAIAASTGCGNKYNIKESPEIMADNAFVESMENIEPSEKMYTAGVSKLKSIMDCKPCQKPHIAGYDAYDETGKIKAISGYIQGLKNDYGVRATANQLSALNWENKTMLANQEMTEWKDSADRWDTGTSLFWLGVAAYSGGGSAAGATQGGTSGAGSANITTGDTISGGANSGGTLGSYIPNP